MPLIALACLLGALCAFYGNQLPDSLWYAYWPVLLWLAFWAKPYRFLLMASAAYLLFSLSFQQSLMDRLPPELHDQTVTLQGKISSLVVERPGRLGFLFEPLTGQAKTRQLPSRIRLTWYQDSLVPVPGSIWELEVKLRPPRGRLNPGGFDYQQWLLVSGIGATGYVRQSQINRLIKKPAAFDLSNIRHELLQDLREACQTCVKRDLIFGLAIGFRGELSKHHRNLLKQTGTAHLLAISGLHIGMAAFMFYWAGFLFWKIGLWRLRLSRLTVSCGLALTGAILFSAMAGFSLPTVRALIFVVIVFMAWLFRERVNLLQCIAIAVVLILVFDPLAVGSASFWLTLFALLTIAFTLFQTRRVKSRIKQAVLLQVAFSFMLLLPSLNILGYFSTVSLPANLVAVPLVTLFILPMILIAGLMLIVGIPSLPNLLLSLADFGLEWLMNYLNQLSSLGFSAVGSSNMSWWLVASLALAVLAWWLPFSNPARKLILVVLLMLTQWQPARLDRGEFVLFVLDSGLGNAIVVKTSTHSLLYDFGPGRQQGYSTYDSVINPFLRSQGIEAADMMIISHVDHDHSGGFYAFRSDKTQTTLLSGTPGKVRQRFKLLDTPRNCHNYPRWSWDGVQFEFLSTIAGKLRSTNNQSCVLSISGYHHAILPGDIERQRELHLVKTYGEQLHAEILVTPHHGSNTSSSLPFISLVGPDAVVHTQSEGNRWGFPHPDVVSRYESLGVRQFSSGKHGAVQFHSTENGIEVYFSRQSGQRIWR